MTARSRHSETAGPLHRTVEIGIAIFTLIFGLIVVGGSIQVGIGWAFDGPRAGFFPFYIGLFIVASSIINLMQVTRAGSPGQLFAEWGQLRQVLSVVIPSMIYVFIVPWIGIYVSSAVLIALFMRRLGGYDWKFVVPIAVSMPLIIFVVFERWFLVPLPKGPIEEFLGF